MDISVAVLVYKSEYKAVLATVMSIIRQSYNSFEIVISDDGSNSLDYDALKKHIESIWKGKLTILNNPKNVGTIQHCINIASICSGKYIKLLGAGDLLHDHSSLQSIVDFMNENRLKVGIGRLLGYKQSSDRVEFFSYRAPLYDAPYLNGDIESIRRNLVYKKDYICGASMFFDREYMIEKFTILGRYLRYVEDLSEYLVVFDNERIMMLDRVVVYYELSSGISTNPMDSTRPLMKNDFIAFWRAIEGFTSDLKEKRRFRGYLKIEELKGHQKFKRLVYRFLFDIWYFILKAKRGRVNGNIVEHEKNEGFLSVVNSGRV